jgi:lipoprotein NlpD
VPSNRSEKTPANRLVSAAGNTAQNLPLWQWPASGKVSGLFQGESGLNKGIDLDGKLGEPVLAAASGRVVYAGSGLNGYGKLLIIKHNDTFLSAYAHNNQLSVKEGDVVKAGQRIADMGSSGTDSVKLHFEIRSGGSPVDPLKYLPKR